jgi:hypothetical protein
MDLTRDAVFQLTGTINLSFIDESFEVHSILHGEGAAARKLEFQIIHRRANRIKHIRRSLVDWASIRDATVIFQGRRATLIKVAAPDDDNAITEWQLKFGIEVYTAIHQCIYAHQLWVDAQRFFYEKPRRP